MSKRIFKNYQINLGMPFQVKVPMDEMFDGHFFAGGDGGEPAGGSWDGGGAADGSGSVADGNGSVAVGGAGRGRRRESGYWDGGEDAGGGDGWDDGYDGGEAAVGDEFADGSEAANGDESADGEDAEFRSYSPSRLGRGAGGGRGSGAAVGNGAAVGGAGDSYGEDSGGDGYGGDGGYGSDSDDGGYGGDSDSWDGSDGYGGGEADGGGWDGDAGGGRGGRRRGAARDPAAAARRRADELLKEAQARCDELLAEAARQAGAAMDAAKREAAEHVAAAKLRHEEENRAIAERAQAEGYAQGRAEGKAQYEQLIADAEKTLDQAGEEYAALMAGAEADAVSLAMDVAKKVIGEDMVINRQNMLSLIKDAFRHCSNKDRAILRVSADDYDFIRMNRDVLLSMIEGVGRLEIKRDLSLGAGACFVETPFGSIDASVATRLSKIEDAFFKFTSARAREAL